jgi:hypothetical protein
VVLRTSQVAVGVGGRPLAHVVALSGVFAWLAVAAVAVGLVAAMLAPASRRAAAPPGA